MSDVASDRRRVPRAAVSNTELSVQAIPTPVRLLDISVSGVRLESSHPVDLGQRGTLRFNFGGVPFSADVRVERIDRSQAGGAERYSIGAPVVAHSPSDKRVIESVSDK
jgi:hypothetical protein